MADSSLNHRIPLYCNVSSMVLIKKSSVPVTRLSKFLQYSKIAVLYTNNWNMLWSIRFKKLFLGVPTFDEQAGQRTHACGAGEIGGVDIDAARSKLSQDELIYRVHRRTWRCGLSGRSTASWIRHSTSRSLK